MDHRSSFKGFFNIAITIAVALFMTTSAMAKSDKSDKSKKSKKSKKHKVDIEMIYDLQDQLNALQTEVDYLSTQTSHQGEYTVQVDCTGGDSINAALADAPSSASNVRVEVFGVCYEHVVANRSNISLWGMTPDAAISVTDGSALHTDARDRIGVILMELRSENGLAMHCNSGSMGVFSSTLKGGATGALINVGCDASLVNSTVDGGDFGLNISDSAAANLSGVTITNVTNQAIILLNNAYAGIHGGANGPSRIVDNTAGISVGGNASLIVTNAEVSNNAGHGISVSQGSYLRVTDGANLTVRDNAHFGIGFFDNATAAFWLGPVVDISGNGGEAIACDDSTRVGGNLTLEPDVTISGAIGADCPANL